MERKFKRILSVILSSTLLITAVGCSSKDSDKKMGRYVEEQYEVPNDVYVESVIKLDNGNLMMLGGSYSGKMPEYMSLISEDGGKNWSQQAINIPSEEDKIAAINNMCPFYDGRIFISYFFEKPLDESQLEEMDKEDYVYEMPEAKYGIIDESGNFEEIEMDLSEDLENEKGGYIQSFKTSENGDVFYIAGENMNELVQIDGQTFEEKNRYLSDEYIENYLLMGNDLIVISWSGIIKYDLESGDEKGNLEALEKETIKSTGNYYPTIVSSNSKDKIYYYSVLGLYVYDVKTEKSKKLVDGSISSFGDNEMNLMGLIEKENDEYLAIFNDWSSNTGSISVINYSYDDTIPTVPEEQIVIYSLIENDTVRQAISNYTKINKDIYIKYETGLSWDNGVTESDALKTLNTEIMNGKGPDILLLDGLSVESYIKNGLLEDLSDVIGEYTKNDEILSNVVEAYTVDGKIYQIPTKFALPMLVGDKDKINKVTDFKSLTELAKSFNNDSKIFTNYYGARDLVYSMYYLYGTDWLNSDNTINEDALTTFMNTGKELYTVVQTQQEKYDKKMEEMWNSQMDVDNGMVVAPDEEIDEELDEELDEKYEGEDYEGKEFDEEMMYAYDLNYLLTPNGNISGFIYEDDPSNLALGGINQSYEFTSLITGMYMNKSLDYKVLTSGEDKIFYPFSKYGVNSNSKNKDLAKDFIKALLSEDVQGKDNGWSDGLPVNKKALKGMFELPSDYKEWYKLDEATNHYISEEYTVGSIGGEEKKMVDVWPNEDDVNRYLSEVEQATKAPTLNKVLLIEVAKQFEAYVNGESTVETAVKTIVDNLDLYLAE